MHLCYNNTLPPIRLLIPLACKQIIPYMYVQPSSWRRNFGFQTCKIYRKN